MLCPSMASEMASVNYAVDPVVRVPTDYRRTRKPRSEMSVGGHVRMQDVRHAQVGNENVMLIQEQHLHFDVHVHPAGTNRVQEVVIDLPDKGQLTESVTLKVHLDGVTNDERDAMEAKILQNLRNPSVLSRLYTTVFGWAYGLLSRSSNYVLKLFKVKRGSIEIVVVSDNPKAIKELKEKVQDGVLTEELKEILLTDDVLKLANGAPVKLKVEAISGPIKQTKKFSDIGRELVGILHRRFAEVSPVSSKQDSIILDILDSLTHGMTVTGFNKNAAVRAGGVAAAVGGFLGAAIGSLSGVVATGASVSWGSSMITAAATVGGVTLSASVLPVAAAVGVAVGALAGSFKRATVSDVIRQLPEHQKHKLVGQVLRLVEELYPLDKPGLSGLVLNNERLTSRIMSNLKQFFQEELSLEIIGVDGAPMVVHREMVPEFSVKKMSP